MTASPPLYSEKPQPLDVHETLDDKAMTESAVGCTRVAGNELSFKHPGHGLIEIKWFAILRQLDPGSQPKR